MSDKLTVEGNKYLVTNIGTGKSLEVEAKNAGKAVDIAHRKLKDGSENEYTWKFLSPINKIRKQSNGTPSN